MRRRATRMPGWRPVYINLHCLGSIDDRIADALARKGNAMEAFRERVNAYRRDGLKQKAMELVRTL